MKLYQLHKKEWETAVRTRLTKREIRERKREKKRKEGVKRGRPMWSSRNCEHGVDKPFNIMLHTGR
jgi:(p)ppGpp synthase/HD superfamily hydrolase